MGDMEDKMWDQVGDILDGKKEAELWAKYKEALESGAWEQARDYLEKITLKILEFCGKVIEARKEQGALIKEQGALIKQYKELLEKSDTLLKRSQEIIEGYQKREAEREEPKEKTG